MAKAINWNRKVSKPKKCQSCKWENILCRMFDTGAEALNVSIHETGHASIESMRNSCSVALKRLGKGTMYLVQPADGGIVVLRNY